MIWCCALALDYSLRGCQFLINEHEVSLQGLPIKPLSICLILLELYLIQDDGVREGMQLLFRMITAEGGGSKEKAFKKLFTYSISVTWLE